MTWKTSLEVMEFALRVRRNEQLEHWLWWLEHFVDGVKEFRKEKETNSSNSTIIEFDFCLF
jgi:hypothetical protein